MAHHKKQIHKEHVHKVTKKTAKQVDKVRSAIRGRFVAALSIIVAVAFIGSVFILSTHADTFRVSAEAEDGTPVNVTASNIPGASGESAVTFGAGGSVGEVSCDQAGIQKLVDSVSTDKLQANLRELVQDDTKPKPNDLISRNVQNPGNQIKVDWAKQQLASYGLEVIDQPFTQGSYHIENLVGRITGSDPNTLYAASGHIDSINGDDTNNKAKQAPGADDNGTGTVAAMEAGRVMVPFKHCMKTSIDFIGFNYEESDEEWGSRYYVDHLAGKTHKGLFNMDMVGWAPKSECVHNFYEKKGTTRDKPLVDRMTAVNTKYGINLNMKAASFDDSDHDVDSSNFWDTNLPSVYSYECDEDYPGYHSTTDVYSNVTFSQVTKITKVVVAALAELSMQ